jgi:hypothetical protein
VGHRVRPPWRGGWPVHDFVDSPRTIHGQWLPGVNSRCEVRNFVDRPPPSPGRVHPVSHPCSKLGNAGCPIVRLRVRLRVRLPCPTPILRVAYSCTRTIDRQSQPNHPCPPTNTHAYPHTRIHTRARRSNALPSTRTRSLHRGAGGARRRFAHERRRQSCFRRARPSPPTSSRPG